MTDVLNRNKTDVKKIKSI